MESEKEKQIIKLLNESLKNDELTYSAKRDLLDKIEINATQIRLMLLREEDTYV